jgi:hypothetical protein
MSGDTFLNGNVLTVLEVLGLRWIIATMSQVVSMI